MHVRACGQKAQLGGRTHTSAPKNTEDGTCTHAGMCAPTCEQEAQLGGHHLARGHAQVCRQREGKQQLVLLKERAAHVGEQKVGEVVAQHVQALGH